MSIVPFIIEIMQRSRQKRRERKYFGHATVLTEDFVNPVNRKLSHGAVAKVSFSFVTVTGV